MTPERVIMEPEETNNTEAPEIHYRDFQIERENAEVSTYQIVGFSKRFR